MRMNAVGQAAHCSLSMSMSFSSKSLMRSWLAASNMNVTESPWSSACIHAGSHDHVLRLAMIENGAVYKHTVIQSLCLRILESSMVSLSQSSESWAPLPPCMCSKDTHSKISCHCDACMGIHGCWTRRMRLMRRTFMVRMSSLPMHFRILAMLLRLTPMLRFRSQRKCSKPSERSCRHFACSFRNLHHISQCGGFRN